MSQQNSAAVFEAISAVLQQCGQRVIVKAKKPAPPVLRPTPPVPLATP